MNVMETKIVVFQRNNRMKYLRKKENLTQKELGRIIGVNQSMISQCESGQKELRKKYKLKLARLFDVTVDYLFYEDQVEFEDKDFQSLRGRSCNEKKSIFL